MFSAAPLGEDGGACSAISLLPPTTPITIPCSCRVAVLMMATELLAVAGDTSQDPDLNKERCTECMPGAVNTLPAPSM